MSDDPYVPPSAKLPSERSRRDAIIWIVLAVFGTACLLLAALFFGAAMHANATIPPGQVNESILGFLFGAGFAIAGAVLLGLGLYFRGKPA